MPDDTSQDQGVAADFSFLNTPPQDPDVQEMNRRRVSQLTAQGQMPDQAQEAPAETAAPTISPDGRSKAIDELKKYHASHGPATMDPWDFEPSKTALKVLQTSNDPEEFKSAAQILINKSDQGSLDFPSGFTKNAVAQRVAQAIQTPASKPFPVRSTGQMQADQAQGWGGWPSMVGQERSQVGEPMEGLQQEIPDRDLNMQATLTAAGWNRPDFIKANTEVQRILQTHGINPTDPVTPSTFPVIVPKIVEEVFNPDVANKFFSEINTPLQGPDQTPATPPTGGDRAERPEEAVTRQGLQDVTGRIALNQAKHDAIWKELANSGNFKNVGDVIGFVLTSVVLGPRAGSMLFSNMNRNGALRNELDAINHETQQLYHQQDSYIQLSQMARKEAATEQHYKDTIQERDWMQQETERHHQAMETYQRMKLGASALTNPEDKSISQALMNGYRIKYAQLRTQQSQLKDIEKRGLDIMDPQRKLYAAQLPAARAAFKKNQDAFNSYLDQIHDWYNKKGLSLTNEINPPKTVPSESE